MGNDTPPPQLLRYKYRKMFGLSAQEMADEPIDEFLTNWSIYGLIQKRKRKEIKKADRDGRRKH